MASQRHRVEQYGASSSGEVYAQGVVAPAIDAQTDKIPSEVELFVPAGANGGPLKGSSLSGAIPGSAQPLATAPVLTSIDPDSATVGPPEVVIAANGSNFDPGAVVVFGGIDVPTEYHSSTYLLATVDTTNARVGPAQVWVRNPNGQESRPPHNFTFLAPETATLASPDPGPPPELGSPPEFVDPDMALVEGPDLRYASGTAKVFDRLP